MVSLHENLHSSETNVVEATPDQTKVNGLANPNYTNCFFNPSMRTHLAQNVMRKNKSQMRI